jgi:hypothetical protein
MATKKLSKYPCPQLLDGIGRPLNVGDYCFYRAGGGYLRFGKITKIELQDASHNNSDTAQRLKISIKGVHCGDINTASKGTSVSIEGGYWYQCPGDPYSELPTPNSMERAMFLLTDPNLLAAISKIVP